MPTLEPMVQEALDKALRASLAPEYILDADAIPPVQDSGRDSMKDEL